MAGLSGPDGKRAARKGGPARARTQAGSTLVELLVATAIMGTAVVALLTATTTLFASSGRTREETTAGIVARDYAEALNVVVNGAWCSTGYTVPASLYTVPSSLYTVTVTSPTTGTTTLPCPSASAAQFQPITITVTTPTGVSEVIKTVVRKP